jgi:hypothetical protein
MRAKWILIGVAVVALGAGLFWVNRARTYDDLVFGFVSAPPEGSRTIEDGLDGEVDVVALRSGRVIDYAVSVRNAGGRTVMITGVGKADPDRKRRDYQMTPVRVRMMPGDGLIESALVPFEPVELGPDEQKTFVLYERMPSCRHFSRGGGTGVSAFDVRFRSLVFDNEQTIELRTPIEVTSGNACEKG